jgi:DNA (cytosine-5)-methyltransferase 1
MLDLGVEIARPGARVLGYVEREAFAASVLLARMEDKSLAPAPVWCGDLAELDCSAFVGQVDCIVAGFPCQPWSVAGKRKGKADERWIWDDITMVIRMVRPRLVFIENVPGIISSRGIEAVLGSLAEIGYDAEWLCLRASDVGASHRRDRFFLLAHSQRYAGGASLAGREEEGRVATRGSGCSVAHAQGECEREQDDSKCSEPRQDSRQDTSRRSRELADAHESGLQGRQPTRQCAYKLPVGQSGAEMELPIFAPGPGDPIWGDILELDPTLEPALCRDASGLAHRMDRLRACGNGVVPLQAAVAFVELSRRMNER